MASLGARTKDESHSEDIARARQMIIEKFGRRPFFYAREFGRWLKSQHEVDWWCLWRAKDHLHKEGLIVRVSGRASGTVWKLIPQSSQRISINTGMKAKIICPKCNADATKGSVSTAPKPIIICDNGHNLTNPRFNDLYDLGKMAVQSEFDKFCLHAGNATIYVKPK